MRQIFLLSGIFIFSFFQSKSQLVVADNQTANILAQTLVGQGVFVSNPTLDCPGIANGVFTATASNLNIDSGIILSSGRVVDSTAWGLGAGIPNATGVFASTATWPFGMGADPDLGILSSPSVSRDRCVLEFDFVTLGDTVKFDYVYGSEEYPGFTCSGFFDVFGFFISGPGITGTFSNSSENMALVPGTNCPVGNNTINASTASPCGTVGPPCSPPNNALFNPNTGGTTVVYSGFTHVLQAVHPVLPCSTYHLKLAIADGGDQGYDSGVFLKAGSFSSNLVDLDIETGLSAEYPYIIEGCDTAHLKITRKLTLGVATADTVHFLIQGSAVNDIDYSHVNDTIIYSASLSDTTRTIDIYGISDGLLEGSEFIKIYVQSGCSSTITDSIIIEIRDSLYYTLTSTQDTSFCLGGSVNTMGTIDAGIDILWTPAAGVADPTQLITTITPTQYGTQYFSVESHYGTCPPVIKTIKMNVDPNPVIDPLPDIEMCEGQKIPIHANVTPPFNYNVTWSPSSGLTNTGGYDPTFVGPATQDIDFTVTSPNAGCTATDQFHAQVWPWQQGTISEDTLVCDGNPVQLFVTGGTGGYLWYPGDGLSCTNCPDPIASSLATHVYNVVLLDPHGCTDTLDVEVRIEPPFTMNLLNNDTTIYLGESVQLIVDGDAPFLYWTPTQYLGFSQSDDPVATPLEDITYTVTGVSLLHGCAKTDSVHIRVITQDVFVPNAFTPNNDGLNDVFKIVCRKAVRVQDFRIMNRWGQEVFSTNDINIGWDGRLNGEPQNEGVYYYMFKVSYANGKTQFVKGDLTLIR